MNTYRTDPFVMIIVVNGNRVGRITTKEKGVSNEVEVNVRDRSSG